MLLSFALIVVVMVATRGTFSTFTNPLPLLHIDACPHFLTYLPDAFSQRPFTWVGTQVGQLHSNLVSFLMLKFTKCTTVVIIHRSLDTLPRESHLGSPFLVTKHWIDPDSFTTNLANVLCRSLSLVVHHTKIEENISFCEFGYPTPSKSIPMTKKPPQNCYFNVVLQIGCSFLI